MFIDIESNKMELSGKLCSLIVMKWLLENNKKKMSQDYTLNKA